MKIREHLWLLRPHQWVKNFLLFVPAIMAHQIQSKLLTFPLWLSFIVFSLAASAVYILNDCIDLESDRKHPSKCLRPLPSGHVSLAAAKILEVVLLALALVLSVWFLPRSFTNLLCCYVALNLAYTLLLKKWALVDVFILASFYTLRIFAGSAATGIQTSEWLLAFSMFFFFSLALVKRYAELLLLSKQNLPIDTRRGYSSEDMSSIPIMGIASGFVTVLVMALYINGDHVRSLYRAPEYLWLICPLILFWICRVWLLTQRGKMHDDPVVFALKDPMSYLIGLAACGLIWISI